MIWLYRIALPPLLALALPYYLFRMWRRGGYRKGFLHRLGWFHKLRRPQPGVKRIWIQAVSVGELLAAAPLLRRFSEKPGIELVITTTTSTGFALAKERYSAMAACIGIFPLDLLPCSATAWHRISPDLVILFESELWPEHLAQAARRKVPVYLVNARLSERSFARYLRFRSWARPLLQPLTAVLASSPSDEERFRALGLDATVYRTGNLKIDFDPAPVLTDVERHALLAECGLLNPQQPDGVPPILLGASTWPGEETALVRAWQGLLEALPDLKLILVPRHAERRREVVDAVRAAGAEPVLRTEAQPATPGTQVYIADTTGELRRFLQVATVVFVGKSLPPHVQGQTPIEAAGYGKALFFGPGMREFKDIAASLVRDGAAQDVPTADALRDAIQPVLLDPSRRSDREAAGQRWSKANRGAIDRTWAHLESALQDLPDEGGPACSISS